MNRTKCIVLNILFLVSTFAFAEDNEIRFKIGVSYRSFDDIDFDATAFRNANNSQAIGGPFGIQNYSVLIDADTSQNSIPDRANADYVSLGAAEGDPGSSDSWGPMIGVEIPIRDDSSDVAIDVVANFQFFNINAGMDAAGSAANSGAFSAFHILHSVQDNMNGTGTVDPFTPGFDPRIDGLSTGSSVLADLDFEVDLYVLDIGLKAAYVHEHWSFGVAAGPTLHIGDVESSFTQQATWTPIPGLTNDPGQSRSKSSDSDTDLVFGGYIAFDGAYQINESLAVVAGYRFDFGSDISTSLAEIDIETHGFFVQAAFDF